MFVKSLQRLSAMQLLRLAGARHITTAGPSQKIKRFYKTVQVAPAPAGGYTVLLERRALKTPKGKTFVVPNEELAHVVALEWDSQEEYINPGLLFAASLCNVVLDHPSNMTRDQRVEQLLPYFQTDTVSFRPSESDTQVLYDHVVGLWDPICDWFDKRYGGPVLRTRGLFEEQDPAVTAKVAEELRRMTHGSLSALEFAVESSKSLVLPLAMYEGQLNAAQATQLARAEVDFQTARFGKVEWAHEMEENDTRARLAAAALVMDLGKDMAAPPGA